MSQLCCDFTIADPRIPAADECEYLLWEVGSRKGCLTRPRRQIEHKAAESWVIRLLMKLCKMAERLSSEKQHVHMLKNPEFIVVYGPNIYVRRLKKSTLLHVKQFPVSSQIGSSREEKRPRQFYRDWLVMERNSSSSLTVLLALCKWRHVHKAALALSKPELQAASTLSRLQGQRNDSYGGKKLERLFWRHHRACRQTSLLYWLHQVSEAVLQRQWDDQWSADSWLTGTLYSIHTPVSVLCCNLP